MSTSMCPRASWPAPPSSRHFPPASRRIPGASSGKHRHPGIELAYVLQGAVELQHEGGAPVTLKAGDVAMNSLGGVHNATNRGTTPVKILTVYIVQKGKPLAEAVP